MGFVIRVRIWREDVWGVGTEEVGVPATDHREKVWDVAGHERETAFDLRDCGVDVEVVIFSLFRVYELVGEDEAGYADCCDAGRAEGGECGAQSNFE